MVWRRYPFDSIWRDMEEMRSDLENLFQQTYAGAKLLPPGGVADRMLPAIRGEFRVDVREHDDEVIVVADLPGVEKEDISLQLVNPRALEVACERKGKKEEKSEGYYMRERVYGSLRRIITLPADVSEDGSTASFKNGVLEVRLKKTIISPKTRIQIE
ncbi:MAG: Small heat shock protein HSP16.5 [Methanoregula sp. PtaU1.Bin051]|nr:MAG: Small heat shock protein HSP16.5 [Methanoregula sp. PtaU1.Bin051]